MTTPRLVALGYPLAFALHAPLALFAANAGHQRLSSLPPALLASLLLSALAMALARLSSRELHTVSLRAFGLLATFFVAGHLKPLVPDHVWVFGWAAPANALVQAALGAGALAVLAFARPGARRERVTLALGTAGALLLAMDAGSILLSRRAPARHALAGGPPPLSSVPPALPPPEQRPHVFYVVLDGYARQDVLEATYGFDNAPFLEELRSRGFFVAGRALANYAQTSFSLASSLNMAYVEELVPEPPPDGRSRAPLADAIRHSRAAALLGAAGYTTVAFATGYPAAELRSADRWETPDRGLASDPFLQAFVGLTPAEPLLRLSSRTNPYERHRRQVLFTLESCPALAAERAPLFVVAHVVAPHPPFVFDPDGNLPADVRTDRLFSLVDGDHLHGGRVLSPAEYRRLYVDQLRFVNRKVLELLDGIDARASRPVAVLLQSDHGPGSALRWEEPERTDLKERLAILGAYRLPGGAGRDLHDAMTPVNSLRAVLRGALGFDLPPVPDRSFFSTWSRPWEALPVEEAGDGSLRLAPPPGPLRAPPSPASR